MERWAIGKRGKRLSLVSRFERLGDEIDRAAVIDTPQVAEKILKGKMESMSGKER